MPLSRIVIVGNDDIAAIAASMIARAVKPPFVDVELVRPAEPVSVWSTRTRSATFLPETAEIADGFGYDELALLQETRGGFLTGTIMRDFAPGAPAFLPFGAIGEPAAQIGFHHLIARRRTTEPSLALSAFMGGSLCAQAARFAPPAVADEAAQGALNYGLHVDNERYAAWALADAATHGVTVTERSILCVTRNDTGDIASVVIDDGFEVTADLFIDCGNWLDDEPAVVDWSDWLPCNRLATMLRKVDDPPAISMQIAAHPGGWQRQGSLFGAVVDSFAFCDIVPGDRPASPVVFRSGRSELPWRGNCIAIGDGAAIIDPVADVRLHLALSAVKRIAGLLPATSDQRIEAREYNRQTIAELDHARDFAIAHYCLNARVGDPFWDHCREMRLPASLSERIALYRSCGRIATMDHETQPHTSWIALFDANGVRPQRYDALADLLTTEELEHHLIKVRQGLVARIKAMPPYPETARLIHSNTGPAF